LFGRRKIYLVASFNDWKPKEMSSIYEIKQARTRLRELMDMEEDEITKLKSKKKDENIIQYGLFVPPGRHFFYM